MIGTEAAAIDRWIEPATEPEPTCQRCGHEEALHDRLWGCGGSYGTAGEVHDCLCEAFK